MKGKKRVRNTFHKSQNQTFGTPTKPRVTPVNYYTDTENSSNFIKINQN